MPEPSFGAPVPAADTRGFLNDPYVQLINDLGQYKRRQTHIIVIWLVLALFWITGMVGVVMWHRSEQMALRASYERQIADLGKKVDEQSSRALTRVDDKSDDALRRYDRLDERLKVMENDQSYLRGKVDGIEVVAGPMATDK